MTGENDSLSIGSRISENLFIAIVPIFWYAVLYVYQFGYFSYFHLPTVLIRYNVIGNFGYVLVLSIVVMVGLEMIGTLGNGILGLAEEVWDRYLSQSALVNYIDKLSINVPNRVSQTVIIFIVATLLAAGIFLAIPYLKSRPETPPPGTPQQDETTAILFQILISGVLVVVFWIFSSLLQRQTSSSDRRSLGLDYKHMSYLAVILLVIAFYSGRSSASLQIGFYTYTTTQELVVLDMDDERLILSPFDRDTGTVEANFTIIKTDEIKGNLLVLETIGPMKSKVDVILDDESFENPTE